ncbi:MAG: DNA-directed RNA polymerase subunit H [Candidatus Thermoplasmatota archaeon]|jgi:DNA-directed RNA polymerase subunit H (RpoH/RPB5)|nr:DNA-directed RNA polymerase subunit H [Candidatus Thermoplasmatota archaeon]MCL5984505.1 DNA-directed RNA polymerase subunit H [Candidatus Thermoplasmatota archaeon]
MPARTSKKKSKQQRGKEALQEGDFVRHNMVPVHILLSVDEGSQVLQRFSTTADKLPKITLYDPGLATDPVYRAAMQANENLVGRVVRIKRVSPTSGEAVTYRIIVEGKLE